MPQPLRRETKEFFDAGLTLGDAQTLELGSSSVALSGTGSTLTVTGTIAGLVIGTDVAAQAAATANLIVDLGDASAIEASMGGFVPLVTASGETRTLANPSTAGIVLTLCLDTDGGDCVVTVAGAYNQANNTIITLADAGDAIHLRACTIGGAARWRMIANDGAALS